MISGICPSRMPMRDGQQIESLRERDRSKLSERVHRLASNSYLAAFIWLGQPTTTEHSCLLRRLLTDVMPRSRHSAESRSGGLRCNRMTQARIRRLLRANPKPRVETQRQNMSPVMSLVKMRPLALRKAIEILSNDPVPLQSGTYGTTGTISADGRALSW